LPVELVFHPNWWHTHYGMSFTEDYFFDPRTRVRVEQQHRRILHERFGHLGLGEADARPKPVIGPVHLAAGYLVSALLGCKVEFSAGAPPAVICRNLSDEEAMALDVPDIAAAYPMKQLLALMDALEAEYGFVEGDVNWGGILNVALDLRGQAFMMDYYTNPALVAHLCDVIYETTINVVSTIKQRTGTSSISVNRIVNAVDPSINLHSNCSVTMISRETYDTFHLPYEKKLAKVLAPYGVHHCGNDMHKVAESYATFDSVLFDVGWGSDVAACRKVLPDAVFSIRLDPVQMARWTPAQVDSELATRVRAAAPLDQVAVCCVNMDSTVPDANVAAIFEALEKLERETG
jgi:uroporphyrinogen-III decarboxylase